MGKYLAACLLLIFALDASADEPLPAPAVVTSCSTSKGKTYCAVSDPARKITLVSSMHPKKLLWSFPGWHRWLFVSHDGNSVVAGYDGMNLIPVDTSLKEPVFFFYHRGKLARTVTLGELYVDKSELVRTVSHYVWVNGIEINEANQLVVWLINGKRIAFSVDSGLVQTGAPDDN